MWNNSLRELWNISLRSMWNEICPHSRQRIFHICEANISQRSYFTCPKGKCHWKKPFAFANGFFSCVATTKKIHTRLSYKNSPRFLLWGQTYPLAMMGVARNRYLPGCYFMFANESMYLLIKRTTFSNALIILFWVNTLDITKLHFNAKIIFGKIHRFHGFSTKFAFGEWNMASPCEIASLWNICYANVMGEFYFTSTKGRYFTISARKLFHIRR